jgi:ATP-dependent helicase/DNAse subunit B
MSQAGKQIWLGPVLGNNRTRLIEMCAELVSEGNSGKFLYLTASHPLLEVVGEGILNSVKNAGIWGELPVYLFRGFVRRILSSAIYADTRVPLTPRTPIDREELPLKRSLISQILKQLNQEGRLRALGPLAGREGCVNTVVSLIGEIQRAGKTPAELNAIVALRADQYGPEEQAPDKESILQLDFDREIALVYETYARLLAEHGLTDDDANGLRALAVLHGTIDEQSILVPWLEDVHLLILDGFFDFTPVQGEMLRLLIPRFPQVIVNINGDRQNPDIFRPFDETIERLRAIADFDLTHNNEAAVTAATLQPLRARLFNPSVVASKGGEDEGEHQQQSAISYLECTDRETEIRAVAKETKRLLLTEGYRLADIALVVRERASYAHTIARVMREESVPCNLDRKMMASEIPAARAAIKLFAILDDLGRAKENVLKMPPLADQIKSGYVRLSRANIDKLSQEFDAVYSHLLTGCEAPDALERRKHQLGVGRWDADALENAIAYVGGELRLIDWIDRCRKLIAELPTAEETKELLHIETAEPVSDDEDAQLEDAETVQKEDRNPEKKRRHQRDLHPATIAWSMMVVKEFAAAIQAVPREGDPMSLRTAIAKLLDQLQFPVQVQAPIRNSDDAELPRAALDLHALEALRRSLVSAIRSIQLTQGAEARVPLTTFIEEARRSLASQNISVGGGECGGLRVLEATDVRGLRFRALFIAGLVEGGFPLSASRDWIYPHEERERLKRHGLTLEDISPDTLLKEEHYFYQAACRATERLYLSRPLLLEGDTETVTSYYVEELRRAIAPATLNKVEVIRPDLDGRKLFTASSARELAVGLVRQDQRHHHGVDKAGLLPHPQIKSFLTLARNDGLLSNSSLRRIEIERFRAGSSFGPYDGQITNPDLLALLRKKFGPESVYSASGLSTFGNCAYRFFAQRVLKLEPRGEAALDLQALDAGKLLHDILRRFFERHREERLDPGKREELTNELLSIADTVFDQHQRVVPPLNKQIWRLDRELRKIILEQVLLFELDVQEKSELRRVAPARFELAFGGVKSAARDPASVDEPLRLTRSGFVGEESVQVTGQIDRVDIAEDRTIIAYDYKLSRGASREDIESGRNLQIPIYLDALEQLFFPGVPIAGGGFYTLRGGTDRRNTGMYIREFNDYLGLGARNSIFSEEEWKKFRAAVRERIWSFIDAMREGGFRVDPSLGHETCKYCDYAAMCRYEKYRIQGKKRTQQ